MSTSKEVPLSALIRTLTVPKPRFSPTLSEAEATVQGAWPRKED